MSDAFQYHSPALDSPGSRAAAVTPNDSTDLPNGVARALYIGGAGNVALITKGGDTVTFVGVQAGGYVIQRVARVKSTGTTATSILALGDW
jgi:hypothetical protein